MARSSAGARCTSSMRGARILADEASRVGKRRRQQRFIIQRQPCVPSPDELARQRCLATLPRAIDQHDRRVGKRLLDATGHEPGEWLSVCAVHGAVQARGLVQSGLYARPIWIQGPSNLDFMARPIWISWRDHRSQGDGGTPRFVP